MQSLQMQGTNYFMASFLSGGTVDKDNYFHPFGLKVFNSLNSKKEENFIYKN